MVRQLTKRYFRKMVRQHLKRSNYASDLDYYRDVTFIKSFIIIHPFSILPAFLGVVYGFRVDSGEIVFWVATTYLLLWLITIPSRLTINQRKTVLTIGMFNFGFQLLINLGMDVSGILYWTIGNMLGSIFLNKNNYVVLMILNLIMSIVIGAMIYFNVKPVLFSQSLSLSDWILIVMNNIFLSIIISIIFTETIQSLHASINKQRQLKTNFQQNVRSLEKSNKLLQIKNGELEQMAYVTSHDLQEPLRMIASFTARLKEKYTHVIDSIAQNYFASTNTVVSKMRTTINDLLTLSTLKVEQSQKELIHIEKLIHQLLIQKNIQQVPRVQIKNVTEIHTYQKPISKIFDNFIDNTVHKYAPENPINIVISCLKDNDCWVFEYLDETVHIESLNQEVQEDFRVQNIDRFMEDYALDITISKLLIEQLEGEIWIESVNKKTVIYFKIPRG